MSSNKSIRFFNPGLTYKKNKKEFDKAIKKVLSEGQLILRKDVEDFEKSLAEYCGTKYAVALNSCTDALYLALRGLKIGPGDEVLVPSRTFVATAQVIIQVGATPVYYDTDGVFVITERTKAIIPVHIEGAFGADMTFLCNQMRERGIYVIEDAAQALGAEQNGKKAGSFGIAGCFSFYPAKTLGCFGDGGALVTNNEELYKWIRDARNHFKEDARDWGVNSRLDNLQAAVLNIRLAQYPQILARRQQIAEMYHTELSTLPITLPPQTQGRIWQDYIINAGSGILRNNLFAFLKEQGVETMKNNYPFPVPKLHGAQQYEDETLRLPCNENLKDSEVAYVIKKIKEFFK